MKFDQHKAKASREWKKKHGIAARQESTHTEDSGFAKRKLWNNGNRFESQTGAEEDSYDDGVVELTEMVEEARLQHVSSDQPVQLSIERIADESIATQELSSMLTVDWKVMDSMLTELFQSDRRRFKQLFVESLEEQPLDEIVYFDDEISAVDATHDEKHDDEHEPVNDPVATKALEPLPETCDTKEDIEEWLDDLLSS